MPVLPGRAGVAVPGSAPIATDAEVAAAVAAHEADSTSVHGITDTSQLVTTTVANATYAELRATSRLEASATAPRIVTLIGGQLDESTTAASCTVSADTVNFRVGGQGMKMTMAGAVTATAYLDPPGPVDPLVMGPASSIGAWVYIPDASKVTTIEFEIYTDSGFTANKTWGRTAAAAGGHVTGWNLFRWSAFAGIVDLTDWGTAYRVRAIVVTNAATDVTIGHLWAECPPKAQILFIDDRGYKTFVDNGLADLRALGIPVTWALDPALNGTSVGTKNEVITDANVATFAAAGDSISFHSWDGSVTSSMTATQIAQDTLKCVRWLQQKGYAGRMWRAAWTQNLATNASAARPFVLAYATPSDGSAYSAWPPPTGRWNIPRISLHGRSTSTVDGYFDTLQKTHGLLVCYTHGIHTDGSPDMTPTEWSYFVSKLQAGVDGGWLEGVTFEDLYARSGGKFKTGLGDSIYEYLDETGTITRKAAL